MHVCAYKKKRNSNLPWNIFTALISELQNEKRKPRFTLELVRIEIKETEICNYK